MSEEMTPKEVAVQALGNLDYFCGQLEALDVAMINVNGQDVIQFKAGALRSMSKDMWKNLNIIRHVLANEL